VCEYIHSGGEWRRVTGYINTDTGQNLAPTATSPAAEPELIEPEPMAEAEQELQTDGDDREGGAYDGVGEREDRNSSSGTKTAPPVSKELLHQGEVKSSSTTCREPGQLRRCSPSSTCWEPGQSRRCPPSAIAAAAAEVATRGRRSPQDDRRTQAEQSCSVYWSATTF